MNYLYCCLWYSCFMVSSDAILALQKNIMYPSLQVSTMDAVILWNEGEVSWDMDDYDNYENYKKYEKNITLAKTPQKSYISLLDTPTPLYNKLNADQDMIAAISVFAKLTHKELVSSESVFMRVDSIFLLSPSDIFILTLIPGLSIVYNKAKEIEIERLQKLYKFTSRSDYFKKYVKIQKITMNILIVIAYIFTKNVQIAE